MNIPSTKLALEIALLDGRYVVMYRIDRGIGSAYPECQRVITGPDELKALFAKLAMEVGG